MDPYLESLSLERAIEYLDRHLLTFQPEEYVLRLIHTVRDIYEHRSVLKALEPTDRLVSRIADIIVVAMTNRQSMRTMECLEVLRSLTKKIDPTFLQQETIDKLFRIYQRFIFHANKAIGWCVSVILKDKTLSDNAIDWLVEHAESSELIANRLLLYPNSNPRIRAWAEASYKLNRLPHRQSEIIALIITPRNATKLAEETDSNTFVWAIYKARMTDQDKVELLKKHSDFESFASVVDIANRLRSEDLIKHFAQKLKNRQKEPTTGSSGPEEGGHTLCGIKNHSTL
jgi:hypothetical protein